MPFDETSSSHIFTSGGRLTGTLICKPVAGTAICFGEERADVPALRRFTETLDVIAGDQSIFQPIRARAFRFAGGPVPPPQVGEGIIAFIASVLQVSNDGAPYVPLSAGIGGNLDDAYHFGAFGTGRLISANEGAVEITATVTVGLTLNVIGTAFHGSAIGTGRGSISCMGSGLLSERFGFDAQAFGAASTAFGREAQAGQAGAQNFTTSVGYQSLCGGGSFSIALGALALASNSNSTAVGAQSIANEDSVAVGNGASANGGLPFSPKIAIGWLARADAINSTAVGGVAQAGTLVGVTSTECVAIGAVARAGASFAGCGQGVAVGNTAEAFSQGSVAIGFAARGGDNLGLNVRAVAIGFTSRSDGIESISIGATPQALGNQAIAIGTVAQANAQDGIAIGNQARANFSGCVAIGRSVSLTSTSVGVNSVLIGNNAGNFAATHGDNVINIGSFAGTSGRSSLNSIAIGTVAQVLFPASSGIAIGLSSFVSGAGNPGIAIGSVSFCSAVNGIALGVLSNCGGVSGIALGRGTFATGLQSISIGDSATVGAAVVNGVAIGAFSVCDTSGSMAVGSAGAPIENFFLGEGRQVAIVGINPVVISATNSTTVGAGGKFLRLEGGAAGSAAASGGAIDFFTALGGAGTVKANRLRINNAARVADDTSILVDVSGVGLQLITRGAANSGGAGFRVLRVPN